MKFISALFLLGLLPSVIFASLISPPTVTSTDIAIATVPGSSSSFLLRGDSRYGHHGEEIQATRTTETNGENNPLITAAPTAEGIQLQEKFHLTTYWSCVTLQTYVHCGWHEPLIPGGTEIAGASCGSCKAGRAAMVAAGMVMAAGAVL